MHRDSFRLQNLLTETAQLHDIEYLLVADRNGKILAHNDQTNIGHLYGQDLDMAAITHSEDLYWRQVTGPEERLVFEVYGRFAPTGKPGAPPQGRMMHPWFDSHMGNRDPEVPIDLAIFIGLKMDTVESAIKADTRHTIIMASILLLVGFSGIVLLLLTQRYQATRTSLSRIKAFSEDLVANMPIGLIAIDPEEKIVSVNPAALSILNLKGQNVIGRQADHALPNILCDQVANLDQRSRIVGQEIECTLNNGVRLPLEISASRLKDERDNFLGHVLLFTDQSEVRGLREEIARNQRLVTVGKLAGGVAHEIRNPLSSIKGFATYFKERYLDVPDDQKIASIMIQEVERLNKVVGQLLEFSRPVKIERERVSIQPFITDSLKLVEKQAADKKIRLKTELSSDIDAAVFDRDRINQVLLNLYLNAIEAMSSGGGLTITVSRDDTPNALRLCVADTGKGIDSADIVHIFDPYFTTRSSGTGLGLAIVHNIIESHGGEIKVASPPDQGTVVTIVLPNSIE